MAEKVIAVTASRLLWCFDISFEDPTILERQSFFEALNPARDCQVRTMRPPPISFTLRSGRDRQALLEQLAVA